MLLSHQMQRQYCSFATQYQTKHFTCIYKRSLCVYFYRKFPYIETFYSDVFIYILYEHDERSIIRKAILQKKKQQHELNMLNKSIQIEIYWNFMFLSKPSKLSLSLIHKRVVVHEMSCIDIDFPRCTLIECKSKASWQYLWTISWTT